MKALRICVACQRFLVLRCIYLGFGLWCCLLEEDHAAEDLHLDPVADTVCEAVRI